MIAWDAPGYGNSSPLAGASPTPADYAEVLLALFDGLHIPQTLLLGQSLGGLMTTAFATRYTAPVLVLSGSSDKLTPEAGCRTVAQAFPCGFYRSLPGLGHGGYVENAALVNRILASYLGLPLPQA